MVLPGEADGTEDIGHTRAADDQRRAAIDHSIVNLAGPVVAWIALEQQVTAHGGAERLDRGMVQDGLPAVDRGHFQFSHDFSLSFRIRFSTNPVTGKRWSSKHVAGVEHCLQIGLRLRAGFASWFNATTVGRDIS
jgi:hypothetical protein